MGVISSMNTAVAGLSAHGQALGVTADNIANASTNGFKTSRAEFHDMMSRSITGAYGGQQIGRGSRISAVAPILSQGSIDNTGRDTDLAINGNGYFALDGTLGRSFSRNGEFHFDKDGYLISSDYQKLKGFEVDEQGNPTNKLSDIQLPRSLVPAKATTNVRIDMNLDARIKAPGEGQQKTVNLQDPYKSADFTTSVEVHDSKGVKHLLTIAFNKNTETEWSFNVLGASNEVVGADPQFNYAVLETGKMNYNEVGKLVSVNSEQKNYSFAGAVPNQNIEFNWGDPIAEGGTGLKGARHFGHVSDLMSWSQDGASAGTLVGIAFSDSGVLTAQYSNGEANDLAVVAMAKFENPEGLVKVGGTKFKQTRESGGAAIGYADHGGRGQIVAGALERSTTDIASEFVDMIKTQRHFQANTKTVTSADEMLADVIAIKR